MEPEQMRKLLFMENVEVKAKIDFMLANKIVGIKKGQTTIVNYESEINKYVFEIVLPTKEKALIGLSKDEFYKHFEVVGLFTEPKQPTFGEKLVGGSIPTPLSKLKADRLKELFAEITDIVNEHSEEMPTDILNKDYGIIQSSIYLGCLTEILKAQMLSVKFVTLSKD